MSNEKISKEELLEKLEDCELSDEAIETIAGGAYTKEYWDCFNNHPKKSRRDSEWIHKRCAHLLK